MKYSIFPIAIVFFLISTTFSQKPDISVNHYKIEAVLSPSVKLLDVNLVCNIDKNTDSNTFQFLFSSEANLKSTKYNDGEDWIDIPFNINGKDSLLLSPKEILPENKNYDLVFDYSLPVNELNDTVLIFDRGHRWYPLISDQIFTYTLECEVPEGYSVLSSGDHFEEAKEIEKNNFVYECIKPVFKLPLIIFNPEIFRKTELHTNRNDIEFYSLTTDSVQTINIMTKADNVLNYFSETIGDYPRKKLIYFEVSDFGGINVGSGLLTIGTQIVRWTEKGYDDYLILTIAQQWFASGVFVDFDQPGFFFLTISLPHYLKLMYFRDTRGEEAFNNSLSEPMEKYKEFAGKKNDMPVIDVDMPNTKEKGLLLYGKGPFILSKIENEMGKENWKLFVKDLYKSYLGKIMTLNDFKNYLSKYDETRKALALFEKLMNEKGMPVE